MRIYTRNEKIQEAFLYWSLSTNDVNSKYLPYLNLKSKYVRKLPKSISDSDRYYISKSAPAEDVFELAKHMNPDVSINMSYNEDTPISQILLDMEYIEDESRKWKENLGLNTIRLSYGSVSSDIYVYKNVEELDDPIKIGGKYIEWGAHLRLVGGISNYPLDLIEKWSKREEPPEVKIHKIEKEIEGFCKSFVSDIQDQYDETNDNISVVSKNLTNMLRKKSELTESLQSIAKRNEKLKPEMLKDLLNLKEMSDIEDIKFKGLSVEVYTNNLFFKDDRTGKTHLGGRYQIIINFQTNDVRIWNLTHPRQGYNGQNMQHPHVFDDGKMCMGDLSKYLPEPMSRMQILPTTMLLINFLKSVNTSDPAGFFAFRWPVKEDDGTIHDYMQEDKHHRYHCEGECSGCSYNQDCYEENICSESDLGYYCDCCGNNISEDHWCSDCEKCFDCCTCITCEYCGDRVEYTCENCNRCEHCCECYYCDECDSKVNSDNWCSDCGRCRDCCICEDPEDEDPEDEE